MLLKMWYTAAFMQIWIDLDVINQSLENISFFSQFQDLIV